MTPRKLFVLPAFLLISFFCVAQSNGVKFTKAQDEGWLVDLEEAYNQSKQTDKPILANFTGSDWCGWCKKLRAEVFSRPEFKTWAKENVILLELDFPRRKRLPDQQIEQNITMRINPCKGDFCMLIGTATSTIGNVQGVSSIDMPPKKASERLRVSTERVPT